MNNNSTHNEPFEELCAAYVLDTLEAPQRQDFEQRLAEASENERQTFSSFKITADHLAFTIDREQPSAQVWNHIQAAIQPQEQEETTPVSDEKGENGENNHRYFWAMAASIALLIASLALLFYAVSQRTTINHQQATITRLKGQVQNKEQMLSVLSARTVKLVVMNGLDPNPNGYGKVIWDADKQQALLQVSNLPSAPKGKAYELWLIKGNKPLPSGVFSLKQNSKNAFFKINQMASVSKQSAKSFAITLEQEGGSPDGKPHGNMYLLGNVGKNTD